jgi:alpha/beta superfamily hydrolase
MKAETMWIDCENARLYGEIYIPDIVPAPALLICHGLNAQGFHTLKSYAQLAKTACENGFVSLVFDFQGVGKSTGEFDYGFGEQKDVKCALNYLGSRSEVLDTKMFVVGHSLGGAVSLYALENEMRVKGLVLWSVPKDHDYNVRKYMRLTRGKLGLFAFLVLSRVDRLFNVSRLFKLEVYGIDLRRKHVRDKLMKLNECDAASRLKNMPVLVVIGENDTIVSVDEAKEVYNSANEPKSLLVIKRADHIYEGRETELIAKTIEWTKKLEKNLP